MTVMNIEETSNTRQRSSKVSSSEIWYTIEGCMNNQRSDGRRCNDIRKYNVVSCTTNESQSSSFLLFSNASSRVTLGSCTSVDIITSIKGEIVADDKDLVEYAVDYLSTSSASDKRHCREMSQLLCALLGNPIAMDKLAVLKGEYYWKLHVDVSVVCDEGVGQSTILDTISTAIYSAFSSLQLPNVVAIKKSGPSKDEFMLQEEDSALLSPIWDETLSLSFPIIITVCIIKDDANKQALVLDSTMEEEECSFMKISYAINKQGVICATRTHHMSTYDTAGGLHFTLLSKLMDIVQHGASFVFDVVLSGNQDSPFHFDKQFLNSQFYLK